MVGEYSWASLAPFGLDLGRSIKFKFSYKQLYIISAQFLNIISFVVTTRLSAKKNCLISALEFPFHAGFVTFMLFSAAVKKDHMF